MFFKQTNTFVQGRKPEAPPKGTCKLEENKCHYIAGLSFKAEADPCWNLPAGLMGIVGTFAATPHQVWLGSSPEALVPDPLFTSCGYARVIRLVYTFAFGPIMQPLG